MGGTGAIHLVHHVRRRDHPVVVGDSLRVDIWRTNLKNEISLWAQRDECRLGWMVVGLKEQRMCNVDYRVEY